MKGRLGILDIWVDAVTMDQALEKVVEFVEEGDRPRVVFAVNPEKNFSVPRNPALHQAFRNADLLIPDGIGVVLAARLLHRARLSRVPGVELMQEICRLASAREYRLFIYGASEEVSRGAAEILEQRYPGLRIVGRANGFVPQERMPELVGEINASGAQILFLALGSPRQEQWYVAHQSELTTVRLCQGIGGSLDTITGRVKRAPSRFCRLNLEWFYRLVKEPSRLKRQRVLPLFVLQVLGVKLRLMLRAERLLLRRPAGKPRLGAP
ncbi:MAG: glycosyl transferase [Geobacteraceae bacterium GWC2_58_44]|nr:MAG: glycosyl transferase [Geobacteraceae bacterium GWC2_58_44]HBG04831.1 glycosyltransferase [Geobacter sp.]